MSDGVRKRLVDAGIVLLERDGLAALRLRAYRRRRG